MNYKTLLSEARENIPEFDKKYKEAVRTDLIDEESGTHTVFSYVFNPLLTEAIKKDKQLAKRMFDFVEKMAGSQDRYVQEVCDFTILEEIGDEYSDKEFEFFLGPTTKKALKLIRQYIMD